MGHFSNISFQVSHQTFHTVNMSQRRNTRSNVTRLIQYMVPIPEPGPIFFSNTQTRSKVENPYPSAPVGEGLKIPTSQKSETLKVWEWVTNQPNNDSIASKNGNCCSRRHNECSFNILQLVSYLFCYFCKRWEEYSSFNPVKAFH